MPDSRLNEAEHRVQQSFSKSSLFNALLVSTAVLAAYVPIRALPDRAEKPSARVALDYRPVRLPPAPAPLRLAGAWELNADDRRFGGVSALAIDRSQFLAISDLGAVARFDRPGARQPTVALSDLREGPGPFGKKWGRDAESLAPDPAGRGWWVGYEQRHSLWLYDRQFNQALQSLNLDRPNWRDNRGVEGLVARAGELLALGENGREAIGFSAGHARSLKLHSPADIAEASIAPDGSIWVLLREKTLGGISQSIAELQPTRDGFRVLPKWIVPKGAFDNFEGMAIERRGENGWRFWLITDDGHRVMARTLLVALDLDTTKARRRGARPSHKPSAATP